MTMNDLIKGLFVLRTRFDDCRGIAYDHIIVNREIKTIGPEPIRQLLLVPFCLREGILEAFFLIVRSAD